MTRKNKKQNPPRQPAVTIDPEFRCLITPLTGEEKNLLEESIKREGCRDPLVTWKGILVDGHHRYQTCTRLNLPYSVTVLSSHQVKTREEAKVWIIRNQFARRNLTAFQRAELALQLEETIQMQAKTNVRATQKNEAASGFLKSERLIHTDKELGKISGLGHDTIYKARVIAKNAPERVKERLRRGATTIYREYRRIVYNEQKESHRSAILESAAHQNTSADIRHCSMEKLLSGFDEELDAIITDPPYAGDNSGLLLKQFLAPFRLRIIWVLNLDPMWRSFLGHAVNGIAPLRNDAFKIKFADLSEEFFATRLDVIYVEDP